MPMATSSAGIARPASVGRGSGSGRATSARSSASPRRSTPPRPRRPRPVPEDGLGHGHHRPVLSGGGRHRRRRMGIHLSLAVRRAPRREAHGDRRAHRIGGTGAHGAQPDEVAARTGRGNAQGAGAAKRQGQVGPAVGEDRASRADLVEAALLHHRRRARPLWVSGGYNARWRGLLAAGGMGFAMGCGMPLWMLKFLKRRREAKFLLAFPDAVDIIVRGIKAGLPLLDSMRIITTDAPEPLKSEFRAIIETQTIGIPLGEACGKLYERIPVAETNFFGIVIAIQQKAGGNLSEALGNLSRVLRDRKKMKAKIQAMSTEAKASATIIAALPFAVMILVYITSPQYIELLWTHPMGRMMLVCSAAWMTIGILVMRKMINFDF